jgi:hypothetical protein
MTSHFVASMEHAWIHQRMLMPAIVFVTRRGTESEPMGTVSDSEAVFVISLRGVRGIWDEENPKCS